MDHNHAESEQVMTFEDPMTDTEERQHQLMEKMVSSLKAFHTHIFYSRYRVAIVWTDNLMVSNLRCPWTPETSEEFQERYRP